MFFHRWLENIREANYNTSTFNFDNFSEFQKASSDSLATPTRVIMTHCMQ